MKNKEPKIELVELDKLIPYARNPRVNDHAVDSMASAIKEFGFRVPIIAKSDGTIVDGHLRLKSAKKLGLKAVPVMNADDMSEAQIKAFRLNVNRMAELADWDTELLKIELDDLKTDFNLDDLGFNAEYLNELNLDLSLDDDSTSNSEPSEADDQIPEVEDNIHNVKLGDIYQLGNHRIMCGDSTDKESVDKLLDGVNVEMVYTDPPYGINLNTDYSSMSKKVGGSFDRNVSNKKKILNDNQPFDASFLIGMCKDVFLWGADYYRDTIPMGGSWVVWDKKTTEGLQKMYGADFELLWSKKKYNQSILRCTWASMFGHNKKDDGSSKVHPTQKPVKLHQMFFEKYVNPKTVLDLFIGSGSTLIACEKTDRKCFGMELDPHYVSVIIERWQNYTGQKAVKLND